MTRTGTSADLDGLVELEQICFGSAAWSHTLVQAALADDLVLVTDDLAGYVIVRVVDGVADLDRIAVHPDHRERGTGRVLLSSAIDRIRDRAVRMLLEVAETNAPALALYSSVGFGEIHRRRDYYPGGTDALVMELVLDDVVQ